MTESPEKKIEHYIKAVEGTYAEDNNVQFHWHEEDDWELVTIYFDEVIISVSKEVTNLSVEDFKRLISDLRSYRDRVREDDLDKPEKLGDGRYAVVHRLTDSSPFCIRECISKNGRHELYPDKMRELQDLIDQAGNKFPKNIKIVHPLAVVKHKAENGYFAPHGAIVSLGGSVGYVANYMVLPVAADGVNALNLLDTSDSDQINASRDRVINFLAERGFIPDKSFKSVVGWMGQQALNIRGVFQDIGAEHLFGPEDKPFKELSARNILVGLENEEIIFYIVDPYIPEENN